MSSSKIEMEEKDIEFVAKLPKIELHLHLDGSLSPGKFKRETCVRIISKKHVYLAKVNFFLDIKNKIHIRFYCSMRNGFTRNSYQILSNFMK